MNTIRKPKKHTVKCKICKKIFTPLRALQNTCSYTCWLSYSKPKQVNPVKKKKIANFSPKLIANLAKYRKLRNEYLEKFSRCQIGTAECTRKAVSLHHQKGRIGELLTDTRYFLSACIACHNWAETHPEEAKRRGVSLDRLTK